MRNPLNSLSNERGFGLAELSVVMALIGALSILAVPNLLSYYQSSSLTAGTEQLAAVMSRARHLAISRNTSVCVERVGTTVRLRMVTCAGNVWTGIQETGVVTSSTGIIQIANDLHISGGTNAIFTNAGGASTPATYTLTDPRTGRSRNVVVTSTGRVSIQ
jgi:prepilin-type N-terminal cleavage/methylation domain-containing protein